MVTKQHSWANDGSFPITSLSVTAPTPGLAVCQTSFESPGHGAGGRGANWFVLPLSTMPRLPPPTPAGWGRPWWWEFLPGPAQVQGDLEGPGGERGDGHSPAQEQCGSLNKLELAAM